MRHPHFNFDPERHTIVLPPPRVEGASAEQLQGAHARAALGRSFLREPIAGTRTGRGGRIARLNAQTPQVFPTRPTIAVVVKAANVGADNAWPRLPGRMPPAGWDGEPGYQSPHREVI